MPELTISQALRYSNKLKNKISDARTRALASLNHKSTETPAFSFTDMVLLANSLSYELAALRGKIAIANANSTVNYKEKEISLAHAVKIIEELKGKISWLKALPSLPSATVTATDKTWDDVNDKYIIQQITTICNLPEARRAEIVDALQEEFDDLNGAIEHINQITKLTI